MVSASDVAASCHPFSSGRLSAPAGKILMPAAGERQRGAEVVVLMRRHGERSDAGKKERGENTAQLLLRLAFRRPLGAPWSAGRLILKRWFA